MSDFLGRGWKFPVKVDKRTGRIMMSEFEDDIKEAIRIIIETAKGERVMWSAFGCDIHEFVYGLTDDTSLRRMEVCVKNAINNWEPRVKDVEVTAALEEISTGKVIIDVSYVVRNTNNLFNLVYPFYIHEGVR